jgi:hypothetical protein
MEKTDLLLKMLDSPQDYSEAQWEEILSDRECRELYDSIAKTHGAVEAGGKSLTDKEIDLEWQKLATTEAEHRKPEEARPEIGIGRQHKGNIFIKDWQRVAAIAAAVVVFSGLAYAAVTTHFFGLAPKPEEPAKVEQSAKPAKTHKKEVQTEEAVKAEPKLFDNVALSEILAELSEYYEAKVEYKDESVKALRLYFNWDPDESLQEVVSTLNNFESFSIELKGGKIVVDRAKER